MSATGDEIVTLSQLKEVYNSIVDKLPSTVTFTSISNYQANNNPFDKPIKWSNTSGDTSLAHLSGTTIVISKQANYTLSFNTNITVDTYDTGHRYSFDLLAKINNQNGYVVKTVTQIGGMAYVVGQTSIELGALNAGATIDVYIGYTNGYSYATFSLDDKGSMCTLKSG